MRMHPKVGNEVDTVSGLHCTVGAVSEDGEKVLLIQKDSATPNYIGAWEMSLLTGGRWCWEQGHYFGEDFASASKYIIGEQ